MKLFNLKISLDKSWKFTPRVFILIIVGIIVILGTFVLVWPKKESPPAEVSLPSEEKTMEEILKDLSVPEEKRGTTEEPSPEAIKSLTAPSKKETPQVPEEILKNLTAPK